MVSGLSVILLGIGNVRGGFIEVVLMCLGRWVYYRVGLCLPVDSCLGRNCTIKEKLGFKRGEDVFEAVVKFCYLGDMISCYGGASEGVSPRIGCVWKKLREISGVLVGKQDLSLK